MTTTTVTDLEAAASGILDTVITYAITGAILFALVWVAATILSTK